MLIHEVNSGELSSPLVAQFEAFLGMEMVCLHDHGWRSLI